MMKSLGLLLAFVALLFLAAAQAQGISSFFPGPGTPAASGGSTPVINWSNRSTTAGTWTTATMNVGSDNKNGSNGTFTSGDLLIAIICISASVEATDPGSVSWPAGWTPIINVWDTEPNSVFGDINYRYSVAWKIAGGSETGSYAATWTSNTRGASWLLFDIGGANGSTPIDASGSHDATAASVSSMVAPSISPTGSNDLLLIAGMYAQGHSPYTTPSGFTLVTGLSATSSGTPDLISYDKALSSSGATGTATITASVSGVYSALSIAITH